MRATTLVLLSAICGLQAGATTAPTTRPRAAARPPAVNAEPDAPPDGQPGAQPEPVDVNPGMPLGKLVELAKARKDDPVVQHALAVAYMRAEKFDRAREPMERAINLTQRPGRELVINRAILDLAQHRFIGRGLKALTDYVNVARAGDEEAANLLGSAIAQLSGEDTVTKTAQYTDAISAYTTVNKALEDTHNAGEHKVAVERRWGVQWLDKFEVDRRLDEKKRMERDVAEAMDRLSRAREHINLAQQELNDLGPGIVSTYRARSARSHMDSAQREFEAAQDNLAKKRRGIPEPTWLPKLMPVWPGEAPNLDVSAEPSERGGSGDEPPRERRARTVGGDEAEKPDTAQPPKVSRGMSFDRVCELMGGEPALRVDRGNGKTECTWFGWAEGARPQKIRRGERVPGLNRETTVYFRNSVVTDFRDSKF